MAKRNIVYSKIESKTWNLNYNDKMRVQKVFFYNGENHYTGEINGEVKTLPAVFFSSKPFKQ